MKEGWTYKKLGEVCDILDYMRKPITKGKRETGSIPYYGATGCLDFVKDFIFDEKLVLLGEDGAKWGSGENSAYIIDGKSWVNNHAHVLRPKRDILIDEFLVYYLNYENLQPFITGVTVPKLNQEKMRSIIIPVTSNKEQQRIVSRLDAAFSHIDELKANAEKQLSEARALFQKSLAKAMEPKEGWGERKFKDLCSFVRGPFGGSLKKEMFVVSGYAVYEQQNAIYNRFNFRYFIDEEKYNSMIRFSVSPGDLIMSCSGTIGKVAIIPDDAAQGIINQALLKLTPKKILDKYYLKYLMESSFFGDLISQYSDGAAIKNIASVAILKDIVLPLPSLSEQQRIVERLDALSAHVRELEENQKKIISECDALKQALLRKVFE